jgi:hypothetical protein
MGVGRFAGALSPNRLRTVYRGRPGKPQRLRAPLVVAACYCIIGGMVDGLGSLR